VPRPRATPAERILSVIARPIDGEGWNCPDCRSDLDVSQPSAADPDFLMGSCARCDVWFVFYETPAPGGTVVVRLPRPAEVAVAMAASAVPVPAPAREPGGTAPRPSGAGS
jgi:hypothetical protein